MNHRTFSIESPTGPDTVAATHVVTSAATFVVALVAAAYLAVCGAPVGGAATPAAVVALSFIQE
jgi:hypothetical protein